VARKGEASIAQVARDFGVSESCLSRWLKLADREDGKTADPGGQSAEELRELKRRNKLLEQENEILRRATAYFARDAPKMMYPLVLDLAAENIPVAVTCRVLGFSKQAFYQWRAHPVTPAGVGRRAPGQRRDRHPPRRPGVRLPVYRRRTGLRGRGGRAQPRAPALQRPPALVGARPQARPEPPPGRPPVHDDLVERIFTAARSRRWCTPTAGSQFRLHTYVRALRAHQLRGSMGRVGACADNAAMESLSWVCGSPRSSLRPCYKPLTRPDHHPPHWSTKVGADPLRRV
jgi:putative transposase